MAKYIKVTRSDTSGSYIDTLQNIPDFINSEFDDFNYLDPGVSITLTIVEMPKDEFDNLPEFDGW